MRPSTELIAMSLDLALLVMILANQQLSGALSETRQLLISRHSLFILCLSV
jgi:hypothetical protein